MVASIIDSIERSLRKDSFYEKEVFTRGFALFLPIAEIKEGVSYTFKGVFCIPASILKITAWALYAVANASRSDGLASMCLNFYGTLPGPIDLLITAVKASICFINIILAPFLVLISPSTCVHWHIECGLAKAISPAERRFEEEQGFQVIAGMKKIKEEFKRKVITPLKDLTCIDYGIKPPNGVLLYGPPGCGKTYFARHIAKEIGYRYEEITVGSTASSLSRGTVIKIEAIFARAAKNPTLIFIDEIEAIVGKRMTVDGVNTALIAERNAEIATLLSLLNDCANRNILVVAATNHRHMLDAAILRTGRFDIQIYIGPPDKESIQDMLRFHMKAVRMADLRDADYAIVAEELEGAVVASDIPCITSAAGAQAFEAKKVISKDHLLEAARSFKESKSSLNENLETNHPNIRSLAMHLRPNRF